MKQPAKSSGTAKNAAPSRPSGKKERLAKALKANLLRRKSAAGK